MNNYSINILNLPKQKLSQFESKDIHTLMDLAMYFPRKYYDFRHITKVLDAKPGDMCALQGRVIDIRDNGGRYTVICEEQDPVNGGYKPQFSVVWFGQGYQVNKIKMGCLYTFCGKVSVFRDNIQICPPIAFSDKESDVCRIMPIYSKIKGMSVEYLTNKVVQSIGYLGLEYKETQKDKVAHSLSLMPLLSAISQMHDPASKELYKMAASRIAFETIYDFYDDLKKKSSCVNTSVTNVKDDGLVRKAITALPYKLTQDQESTIEKIMGTAKSGRRINALISGDVGCGKTIIAILASIFMCENGYQTIVMAPTLVLTQQHFSEFSKIVEPLGIKVALLTTETKQKDRKKIFSEFGAGNINILIGTHAVLGKDVIPQKLGMTIIDEEHKFGVEQKMTLESLAQDGIHHLSMTATPIPRSIAKSVYGMDTDVMSIRTMPSGRLPVITKQRFSSKQVFEEIYEEVQKGHQAYIVCPFIDTSDQDQFADVISVSAVQVAADKYFLNKQSRVRTAVLTGDMPQKDIIRVINSFVAHEIDVLISTTIVEVGVNVPNATIIAIMSADRFGLAALHQLRGRVGRSSYQSYCLLCAKNSTDRLNVLCETNDGFEIAEKDLAMRGPGDIMGTAQSGDSKSIETIIKFPRLAAEIRNKLFSP